MGNQHSFRGYQNTHLYFDSELGAWRLQLHSDSDIYAVANTTDYPFGTHLWHVRGEPCYDEDELDVWLNVNACGDGEFNCQDGECVGIERRCDGRLDCSDRTDEAGCSVYEKEDSYIRQMPPEPVGRHGDSTWVRMGVDVLAILDIEEVDGFIQLQLNIRLTW